MSSGPVAGAPELLAGPQRGGRRWRLTLLLAGMLAIATLATTGAALTPSLLAHQPLLLIAMNPSVPHLVTVAPATDIVAFILVACGRLLLSDPLYLALGRWFGGDAVAWAERRAGRYGSLTRMLEAAFARYGNVLVLVAPYGMVCLLAGAAKMSLKRFWALNFTGTLTMVVCLRLFGESIAAPIARFTAWVDLNSSWLSYVVIGAILVGLVFRVATKKRDPRGVDSEIELDSRP